jgi:hypothetical protein
MTGTGIAELLPAGSATPPNRSRAGNVWIAAHHAVTAMIRTRIGTHAAADEPRARPGIPAVPDTHRIPLVVVGPLELPAKRKVAAEQWAAEDLKRWR